MLPNSMFAVTSLTSPAMVLRERMYIYCIHSFDQDTHQLISGRLKEAKTHCDKNQRELLRDRQTLERKEKQLVLLNTSLLHSYTNIHSLISCRWLNARDLH